MATLTIEDRAWSTPVPASRGVLLDDALRARIPVPHQCRAGECGVCKCRVIHGDVVSDDAPSPALTAAERRDGWILPCRTRALSDVTVRYPVALPARKPAEQRLAAQIRACARVEPGIVRLDVETVKPLDFHAGQYVRLRFPGLPARMYSPANAPGTGLLRFYIRVVPNGLVSRHIAEHAKLGRRLQVIGPGGDACLTDAPAGPLLLVGGGSGLAPLLSILERLAQETPATPIWLYTDQRTEQPLLAGKPLKALEARLAGLRIVATPQTSNRNPTTPLPLAAAIRRDHASLAGFSVFTAGSPQVVAQIRDMVTGLGVAETDVKSDPFIAQRRGQESLLARLRAGWPFSRGLRATG